MPAQTASPSPAGIFRRHLPRRRIALAAHVSCPHHQSDRCLHHRRPRSPLFHLSDPTNFTPLLRTPFSSQASSYYFSAPGNLPWTICSIAGFPPCRRKTASSGLVTEFSPTDLLGSHVSTHTLEHSLLFVVLSFVVIGCSSGSRAAEMTSTLIVSGSHIDITVEEGKNNVSQPDIIAWVKVAAEAVAGYYGHFPWNISLFASPLFQDTEFVTA